MLNETFSVIFKHRAYCVTLIGWTHFDHLFQSTLIFVMSRYLSSPFVNPFSSSNLDKCNWIVRKCATTEMMPTALKQNRPSNYRYSYSLDLSTPPPCASSSWRSAIRKDVSKVAPRKGLESQPHNQSLCFVHYQLNEIRPLK